MTKEQLNSGDIVELKNKKAYFVLKFDSSTVLRNINNNENVINMGCNYDNFKNKIDKSKTIKKVFRISRNQELLTDFRSRENRIY